VKLLLDTHVFLWYITDDLHLPRFLAGTIRDSANETFLSVVSVWEVLIKHQTGKLPLPVPVDEYLRGRREEHGISSLALEERALSGLLHLPMHHSDPFDRMLISQALHHDLAIATVDKQFSRYRVRLATPG
jgi:PIN domain nuclease of toxin-antitoxin system